MADRTREVVEMKDCLPKCPQSFLHYNLFGTILHAFFLVISPKWNFNTTDRLCICLCSVCVSVLYTLEECAPLRTDVAPSPLGLISLRLRTHCLMRSVGPSECFQHLFSPKEGGICISASFL